jgi:hypothetical protein
MSLGTLRGTKSLSDNWPEVSCFHAIDHGRKAAKNDRRRFIGHAEQVDDDHTSRRREQHQRVVQTKADRISERPKWIRMLARHSCNPEADDPSARMKEAKIAAKQPAPIESKITSNFFPPDAFRHARSTFSVRRLTR